MSSKNACYLGEPYRPCNQTLLSLTSINLNQLRLETHHMGHVLIAKTFTPATYKRGVQVGIEDVQGNAVRLLVTNLLPVAEPDEYIPEGTIVAIKQP
jgi:hypothetical protein